MDGLLQQVQAFLDRYRDAFVADDLDALVEIYDYPCAIHSDDGTLVVTTPDQVRDFFGGNGERFRSQGLVAARGAVQQVIPAGQGGLAVVHHRWEYLREDGAVGAGEQYVYVLRRNGETFRICSGIPSFPETA